MNADLKSLKAGDFVLVRGRSALRKARVKSVSPTGRVTTEFRRIGSEKAQQQVFNPNGKLRTSDPWNTTQAEPWTEKSAQEIEAALDVQRGKKAAVQMGKRITTAEQGRRVRALAVKLFGEPTWES